MKGIIFNLLEQFIIKNWGEEEYERILAGSPLQTKEPFVGPGTYPDEDLFLIISKMAQELGISVPDVLRAFGKYAFHQLAARYPSFARPYAHPKPFLKTVDSVIHVEVRKLYEDTQLPRFLYRDPAPDKLVIEYRSQRRLCLLMEGLIDGVAEYYRCPIQHRQTRCMLQSGDVCEFDITFASATG